MHPGQFYREDGEGMRDTKGKPDERGSKRGGYSWAVLCLVVSH